MNAKVEEVDTILDPEELADIEAEQIEMAEEQFRAERWPAYVTYVDSLVWFFNNLYNYTNYCNYDDIKYKCKMYFS